MARQGSKNRNTDEALQARLALLTREHTISAMARRTDTPASTVHRYVNGGRVPADFCAALAREFQLSPAWLLAGEGPRYATDLDERVTGLASGMRQVVDAMNAASRLKLGSLTSRRDLGLLRELADAAERQERMRGNLSLVVEPVLREWLTAFRTALSRFDEVKAGDLEVSLERLISFTDNGTLIREFDRLKARSAYVRGHRAEAVRLQRRNLMLRLADSEDLGDTELGECHNLCATLLGLGRVDEARAVARATLELYGADRHSAYASMLKAVLATCELWLGRAHQAVRITNEVFPLRKPANAPTIEFLRASVMLAVDGFGAESVLRELPASLPIYITVLRHLLWQEDGKAIRTVLESMRREDDRWYDSAQIVSVHADAVLALLNRRARRKSPPGLEMAETRYRKGTAIEQFDVDVFRCQRARLSKASNTRKLALEAHARLLQFSAGMHPSVTSVGLHARNILALSQTSPAVRSAAAEMRQRIAKLVSAGFCMFREFAAKHKI